MRRLFKTSCRGSEWHRLGDGVWHSVILSPRGDGYYIDGVLHKCEFTAPTVPNTWWRRMRLRLGAAMMPGCGGVG